MKDYPILHSYTN